MADNPLITEMTTEMDKALSGLKTRLSQMRTGRASTSLLDGIRVEQYGSFQPLHSVATVAVQEARTITINPWEKSLIGAIERAIQKSDLGLNPQNDGKIIRISIPPLTGDRRKDLVKTVGKEGEAAKVILRSIRRDFNEKVKAQEKEKKITEDESRRSQTKVQEATDKLIGQIDKLIAEKEHEIAQV